MKLIINEQKYKSIMFLLIPILILIAYDAIFSVQSILPVIISLFCYELFIKRIKLLKTEIYIFLIFIIVSVGALIQNMICSPELITSQTFIRIIYHVVILYMYFSITSITYTEQQINKVIYVSVFSGVLVSLYFIFVQQIWFISLLGVRVDKNFVGVILALEAELALIEVFEEKKVFIRFLFLISCLIMILGIFYSASRGAVLVFILGSFVIILSHIKELCKTRIQFMWALFWSIVLPIVAVMVIFVLRNKITGANVSIQWYWNRYFVNGFGDESVTGRWVWWRNALEMWCDRPLWGYGIGNVNVTGNSSAVTHNTYLDFLLDQGIVGFSCFGYILFRSIRPILKNKQYKYYALIVTLLLSIFILSATRSTFLWFSLMLLYSIGNKTSG